MNQLTRCGNLRCDIRRGLGYWQATVVEVPEGDGPPLLEPAEAPQPEPEPEAEEECTGLAPVTLWQRAWPAGGRTGFQLGTLGRLA
jgi:hypothetical protein